MTVEKGWHEERSSHTVGARQLAHTLSISDIENASNEHVATTVTRQEALTKYKSCDTSHTWNNVG